jgi:hypothetical protein
VFSGGSYEEVARWLKMFLNSHAKREHPRIEAVLDDDEPRENVSYATRLVLGERTSPVMEFDYKTVAAHRGELAWCMDLARRVRREARVLLAGSASGNVATRQ